MGMSGDFEAAILEARTISKAGSGRCSRNRAVIELVAHAEGVIVWVKAEPGSRHQGIRGEHGGAQGGRPTVPRRRSANQAASSRPQGAELGVKKQQVELLSGRNSAAAAFLDPRRRPRYAAA